MADEYEVVFKELFVLMNGAAKRFATSWILKLILLTEAGVTRK